jgi:Tfp pilus assembly protein PilF
MISENRQRWIIGGVVLAGLVIALISNSSKEKLAPTSQTQVQSTVAKPQVQTPADKSTYITLREDAAYLRGLSSLERQDSEQAIVEFTEAIQTDASDRAFAYLKRATAYEKKGNRDSALADYRMALKVDNSLKQQVDAAIRRLTAKR